ncbi:hypothetical protein [Arthrobacter bambusae]|uniref:hypothetical protein n=1 Tax=Arthrobacter bambusae TaxID=1338426 RepID=UPI0027879814|nr:hypothetical protein [Arthrobacter bambusae]MDQ0030441.1 hypothetical protein [Arthrobacter bambusae]MDQ0098358.1 hypothetical protein [Arthrobacter bambusae]
MLKTLVRLTSFGIAIFLSILAGIVISTADDAFPLGADFKVRLDFTHSQLTKDQAIADLDSIADASGLRLAKLVADPNDFFNSRSLYAFGQNASAETRKIDWFKPGMTGQLLPSGELGTASLNGPYVYSGSPTAVGQFIGWIDSHGIGRNVVAQQHAAFVFQDYGLIEEESIAVNVALSKLPVFGRRSSRRAGVVGLVSGDESGEPCRRRLPALRPASVPHQGPAAIPSRKAYKSGPARLQRRARSHKRTRTPSPHPQY